MFAIAKNVKLVQATRTIPYRDWCKHSIVPFNFDEKGFKIKGITLKKNFNPRFLSQIEVDEICSEPIDFNSQTTTDTVSSHEHALLPFGIPRNDVAYELYEDIMENIYSNGPRGKLPNSNITCSMLMSLMRAVVFVMGRDGKEFDPVKEKHYVRILLTLYHTTKKYIERNTTFKSLVDGLVDCVSTRDVTQREITIMLKNNTLTSDQMEQLLTIAFSRSNKYYKKQYGDDATFSLTRGTYLKGKFGLFFIVPLLKYSTEYSEASVDQYWNKLNEMYTQFYNTGILDRINQPDTNWEITSEMCKIMYNIMADHFNLVHKDNKYFVDMLQQITNTNIADIEDVLCKHVSDICVPIKIPHKTGSKTLTSKPITKESDKNDNELIFTPPRITKWSTFVVNIDDDKMLGLTWNNYINAKRGLIVAPEIRFLGYIKDGTVLNNNHNGCFSPINEKLTIGSTTTHVIPQKESNVLLHRKGDNIEIYTETGKVVFQGSQIVIAFKNIKLTTCTVDK